MPWGANGTVPRGPSRGVRALTVRELAATGAEGVQKQVVAERGPGGLVDRGHGRDAARLGCGEDAAEPVKREHLIKVQAEAEADVPASE